MPAEAVGWLILDDHWSDDESPESKFRCSKTGLKDTLIDSDDDFADIVASKDFGAWESTSNSIEPTNATLFDDEADEFLVDAVNATEFLY